eukprot:evm.model.scf_1422.1 EVM.evm.TU.scf_1422.1   scf_1422:15009-22671(-)
MEQPPAGGGESGAPRQPRRYLAILDFEATCHEKTPKGFTQEIIEFPVVLVDTEAMKVADAPVFHKYVRPVHNPVLSEFCTELTGIRQETVDQADTIEVVFAQFVQFLTENRLSPSNTIFCTCGDWDLKTMWPNQARTSQLATPDVFRAWANVKSIFRNVLREYGRGMMNMLDRLGLPHQGRHHSGIDDTRNIARIAIRLMELGAVFDYTSASPS